MDMTDWIEKIGSAACCIALGWLLVLLFALVPYMVYQESKRADRKLDIMERAVEKGLTINIDTEVE